MAKRADRIARATLEGASPSGSPYVGSAGASDLSATAFPENAKPDFVSDVVGMTTDRLAGAYDVKAMKVRDRMLGDLMDLIH